MRLGATTWGKYKKKAALDYGGKQALALRAEKDRDRRKKEEPIPSNPALELQACAELRDRGFLPAIPKRCTFCKRAGVTESVRRGSEALWLQS